MTVAKLNKGISLDDIVVQAPDQVSSNIGDDSVILHLKEGVYFGLNFVGSRIWDLLQQPRKVRAIRDTLQAEFEVEAQRCEEDLLKILEEMESKGLIEVKGESGK